MKLNNPRYAVYVFLLIVLGIAIPLAFIVRARLEMGEAGRSQSAMDAPQHQTPLPEAPKEQAISRILYASDDGVTTVEIAGNHYYTPILDNPTMVSGTTTAFENRASWKLVDGTGQVISGGSMYVFSPDMGLPGPFSFHAFYDAVPKSATGTLTVYEASAKDGTSIHEVRIPVKLKYSGAACESPVTVYFAKKGITDLDCGNVQPVTRSVCGASDDANLVIHELLKGPTVQEAAEGYTTGLPDNVNQPDIRREAGQNVTLTFDDSLEQGMGGSCRVSVVRAQFEETLQANGIIASGTQPVISVNGRVEDVLQP